MQRQDGEAFAVAKEGCEKQERRGEGATGNWERFYPSKMAVEDSNSVLATLTADDGGEGVP